MKKTLTLCFITLISLFSYGGDILTLINREVYDGKVIKIKDCFIVFKTGDEKFEIPAEDIYSIQFEDPTDRIYTKYMEMPDDIPEKCLKGKLDAASFHGKKGGHVLLGFLFGPFAIIGTLLANPNPDNGRKTWRLSQNKDLFNDPVYRDCYKRKAKGQLIGCEIIGWGIIVVLALASS